MEWQTDGAPAVGVDGTGHADVALFASRIDGQGIGVLVELDAVVVDGDVEGHVADRFLCDIELLVAHVEGDLLEGCSVFAAHLEFCIGSDLESHKESAVAVDGSFSRLGRSSEACGRGGNAEP